MKKKSFLKASALSVAIGATAIGCDVLGNNEDEQETEKDWRTDSSLYEPHTGVSCDEIKYVEGLSYEEVVNQYCNLVHEMHVLEGPEAEMKMAKNDKFCLERELEDNDMNSSRINLLKRIAGKRCIENFFAGILTRRGDGLKIDDASQCEGIGAFEDYTGDNVKPQKKSQRDICEENFGI